MKQPDIMRQAGAEWRGLSDAEKAPYNKLAATDKVRLYHSSHPSMMSCHPKTGISRKADRKPAMQRMDLCAVI